MGLHRDVQKILIETILGVAEEPFEAQNLSLGLSRLKPAFNGVGWVEPVGGAYERQVTEPGDWTVEFDEDEEEVVAVLGADLVFQVATTDWLGGLPILYGLLFNEDSDLIGWGIFAEPFAVAEGSQLTIPADNVKIKLIDPDL